MRTNLVTSIPEVHPGKRACTFIINRSKEALSTVQHSGTELYGDSNLTVIAVEDLLKQKPLIRYLRETHAQFSRIPGFKKADDLNHLDALSSKQKNLGPFKAMA